MQVYKEICGTSRKENLVTQLPGSDNETNSYYDLRPVEVTEEQFELLLKEDSEDRKDLVKQILESNK